jgi:hypothetical protein
MNPLVEAALPVDFRPPSPNQGGDSAEVDYFTSPSSSQHSYIRCDALKEFYYQPWFARFQYSASNLSMDFLN